MAEANPVYREVIESNFSKQVRHIFTSVKEQIEFYRGQGHVDLDAVDVVFTGPLENPLRAKRFNDGSTANQRCSESMANILDVYRTMEPKLGLTEQPPGFDHPDSPKRVFLGSLNFKLAAVKFKLQSTSN